MDSRAYTELRRRIVATRKCRTCGSAYPLEQVYILGQSGSFWAVALKCASCGGQGVLLVPTVTYEHELTPAEERYFHQRAPISDHDFYILRSAFNAMENDIAELWQ